MESNQEATRLCPAIFQSKIFLYKDKRKGEIYAQCKLESPSLKLTTITAISAFTQYT